MHPCLPACCVPLSARLSPMAPLVVLLCSLNKLHLQATAPLHKQLLPAHFLVACVLSRSERPALLCTLRDVQTC